jgi:hypothetical protein
MGLAIIVNIHKTNTLRYYFNEILKEACIKADLETEKGGHLEEAVRTMYKVNLL